MTDKVLKIASTMISVLIILLGAHTLFTKPVSSWGGMSMTVACLLLVVTTILLVCSRVSFFNLAAFLYATVLTGRLFGTLRLDFGSVDGAALDPLMIGETGPGIPAITFLSYVLVLLIILQLARLVYTTKKANSLSQADLSTNDWGMIFVRVYVGLMFIAHYSGHILAGPHVFKVFVDYFATVGFHIGAPMVILAGLIEVAVSLALVFGFMTRIAGVGAISYLFFATLWGEHFAAGYVWVLPKSGWEFSALWMAMIAIVVFTGAGKLSIDHCLKKRAPVRTKWLFI